MASDQEQKSILVPQHKRIAQGEKIDGTKMQPSGAGKSSSGGGLSQVKPKK